jgi:hypothetical protein
MRFRFSPFFRKLSEKLKLIPSSKVCLSLSEVPCMAMLWDCRGMQQAGDLCGKPSVCFFIGSNENVGGYCTSHKDYITQFFGPLGHGVFSGFKEITYDEAVTVLVHSS